MKRFPNQRIAITGGASGLGKALALRFARAGWKVAIADIHDQRGEETLAELQNLGVEAFYQRCDVTQVGHLQKLKDILIHKWGGVDIMVNNAGVATHGPIDTASLDDWDWVIDINLMGVVRGCKLFSQLFKEQGYGHLINVASIAGLIYSPEMASYNATKAGVVALSETLRAELAPSNIGVSVVCPGFFQTNLAETARSPDAGVQQMINKLLGSSKINSDDIANIIYQSVAPGKFWILPHASYKYLWYLKRYLPTLYHQGMVSMATKMLNKRKRATDALTTE